MLTAQNKTEPNYSPEEIRKVLGKSFWKMANYYGFTREEQAILLGISPNNRSVLTRLEEELSIPESETAEIVTSQLLGIHKNLGILYPRADEHEGNFRLKKSFFKRPCYELSNERPIDFITKDRMRPLSRVSVVRRVLDIVRTQG